MDVRLEACVIRRNIGENMLLMQYKNKKVMLIVRPKYPKIVMDLKLFINRTKSHTFFLSHIFYGSFVS